MSVVTGRRVLVTAVVLIIAGLALALARDHRYVNLAATSLAEARQAASPAMTYEQARDWLAARRFHVVMTSGGNYVSFFNVYEGGRSEHFTTVDGLKNVGRRAFGLGDRWIKIQFLFSPDGEFKDVRLVSRSG